LLFSIGCAAYPCAAAFPRLGSDLLQEEEIMTTQDKQPLFLSDLCARWSMDADQILEFALAGKLELWIDFTNVLVQKTGKVEASKKKKTQAPQFHELIEVKPQAEILTQLQGRCDRLLIGAEFPCFNAKNKEIAVSNSVGEEWGETSMLGLKPASLYARLNDVIRFERKHRIEPHPAEIKEREPRPDDRFSVEPDNSAGHPCFAPELHAAVRCWAALFSREEAEIDRTDVLAWLRQEYPELSKAASERIARVVTPANSRRRTTEH